MLLNSEPVRATQIESRGRRRHPRLKIYSREWPGSTDHMMHYERSDCMIGCRASAHLLSEFYYNYSPRRRGCQAAEGTWRDSPAPTCFLDHRIALRSLAAGRRLCYNERRSPPMGR